MNTAKANPNPKPLCSERGCTKSATWRIETQDEDGEYIDIHVCDEHYPQDHAINEGFINVKRIRHSTGTEFQEDHIR
jgi:hypothetical protein